jgi:hypothetical protein
MAVFDTFDRTGNAEFPFPKAVVFRAVDTAVAALRMNVASRDELASRIDIKTGASAFSWGERVAISVMASGDQSAVVSIQSASKTVIGSGTAHGKNRKNVRGIISKTSEILQESGVSWRGEMGLDPAPAAAAGTAPSSSVADELAKLAQLRDQGVLTEAEFAAQKARLLEAG